MNSAPVRDGTASHFARKWAAVCYLTLMHLLLVALILKTDFVPRLKVKMGIAATPISSVQKLVQAHQRIDDLVPDQATIFLGDSITRELATAAIAPYPVNYGIHGEDTAQLLDAIPTYKSLLRANAVVLTIGINDLHQGRKAGLGDRFQQIVAALPKNTPLIWSTVMPAKKQGIALSDIAASNKVIKTLCEKRGNCVYVDTWSFLADEDGAPIPRYFLEDGIHLSAEGYRIWTTALKRAMPKINAGK